MKKEMKREDVNKGQLIIFKHPLIKDYKMKDYDYDC